MDWKFDKRLVKLSNSKFKSCSTCTATLIVVATLISTCNGVPALAKKENSENFSTDTNLQQNSSNVSVVETYSTVSIVNITQKDLFRKWAERHLTHSIGYTLLLVFGYLVVFVVGITGNMLVVLILVLKPHIRTVKNLFILNLAVADLLLLSFCVICTLLANILKSWVMGSFMCSAVTYIQGVSVIASAYSLVALSFDRCKAITQKALSRRGFSKTQALVLICLIWIFALVLPLPWALVFELYQVGSNIYCRENWGNTYLEHGYFFLANLFCCYMLPLILISVANLVIWWKVANRPAPTQETFILSSNMHQVKDMHTKTKRGVGKMLGTVTFTFLISWLPLYIIATRVKLALVQPLGLKEITVLGALVPPAQWLAYWNSCINPVFYAFFNAQFRQLFKSFLPKWLTNLCCQCGHTVSDRSRLVQNFG